MKFLHFIVLFAITFAFTNRALPFSNDDLISLSQKSDAIYYVRIQYSLESKPNFPQGIIQKVSILDTWKERRNPAGNAAIGMSCSQWQLGQKIPPVGATKGFCDYIVFCSLPVGDASTMLFPIVSTTLFSVYNSEHASYDRFDLPVKKIKDVVLSSTERAEQGAAANP